VHLAQNLILLVNVHELILKIYLIFITIDYTTANGPNVIPALTETQKADLYAELASGAESGWDYSMRWFPTGNLSTGLLALNVRNTIAVDLNSLLCMCGSEILT
jgi:neutral trehalase